MTDLLATISKGGLCHGCGGCAAAVGGDRIRMVMSDNGYLRPSATTPLHAEDQAIVAAVCSGREIIQHSRKDSQYDALWGPLVTIETGYSTDPEIRYHGSSGGVLTGLLAHLLETGAVDFVVHSGADPADPLGNASRVSRTRADVITGAGSRYAPSSPLADFERHLAEGRPFAFVGKPCDVATLRRMALRDPRIDRLVPYKFAFFCAGVPSRKGAVAVLEALGVLEQDVTAFAYRGRGWPGLTRATTRDGRESSMDYNSSWGGILNRHLQFRCKICPDGTGEFADVVCADAWYGKDGYPDFAERDGRSLIVTRTAVGRRLLDNAVAAGAIAAEHLESDEIRRMQPYQVNRKSGLLARLAALWLKPSRVLPRYRGLGLGTLAVRSSPTFLLRTFAGAYRRLRKSDL